VRLTNLGIIRVRGAEAAKFLHSQLTQDFALLGMSEARLAALCSPKGRMLASFVGFKQSHDDILLMVSQDLLAPTLKRLKMFVLRAKVELLDASADYTVWGVAGVHAEVSGPAWSHRTETESPPRHWVTLYPGAGVPRALCVVPNDQTDTDTSPLPGCPMLDAPHWAWLEVMSGVAMVTQPLVEAFVPQMLNYESVGGVNFKKGCYPGQEVVARSQFRGTLKRRAYLVACDGPLSVGQAVFHSSDAEQPCGTVAAAAPSPTGGWHAIVAMQTQATESGSLSLENAELPDTRLQLLPLPYPLRDDI
jgi:folate-binding protein YgfZ